MDRRALGSAGEDRAVKLYEDNGFEVIERNFRCREGEIDLIARRGRLIVFCEVKARSSAYRGMPAEAVGSVKQMRLRRAAGRWLALGSAGGCELRFDVVSIVWRHGHTELVHIPGAF